MPQKPIIRFPNPRNSIRPTGSPRNIPSGNGPGINRQRERFSTTFDRLSNALDQEEPRIELRNDPLGIAPGRALVFVTASSIQNFWKAARNVDLNVFLEEECQTDIPEEFSPPENSSFSPVLYATMPTIESFRSLLSLWNAFLRGDTLPIGSTPWKNLFELLIEIRTWGPEDRLPDHSSILIGENLPFDDNEPVKLELEIFPNADHLQRQRWIDDTRSKVVELGGRIIDHCTIDEERFIYCAILIELSTSVVRNTLENPNELNGLATIEGVQFILPQSTAQSPEFNISSNINDQINIEGAFDNEVPIRCALFDGTAIASHPTIENGIEIEDINDLVRLSQVNDRYHATSMASLILRGDLLAEGNSLEDSRLMNIPILIDTEEAHATSPDDRLFVDVVHSTLTRLFSDTDPIDHQIFVINFSIGINSERYAGRISTLARLLDWWAYQHGVLFIVAAGNITDDLMLSDISITEFEDADAENQQIMIKQAMREFAFGRTLLAPAESINSLTVGALSEDALPAIRTSNTFTLESDQPMPAISSALGPGKSKTVKPDILMTGGIHEYSLFPSSGNSRLILRNTSQNNGLNVASPGSGTGISVTKSRGTSCSTALTTRAILQAAASLTTEEGPFQGEELPREDLALITRALAVNASSWNEEASILYEEEKSIHGVHSHFRSKEEVSKYFGFGVMSKSQMNICSEHSATLIGLGTISKDEGKIFDFPLPNSLSGDRIGRNFKVTIAWFSPIDSVNTKYRMAALEAFAGEAESINDNEWGLGMKSLHLDEKIVNRGSVWSRRLINKRISTPTYGENTSLPIRVQCRDTANGNLNPDEEIRFAIVVTLEIDATAEYDIHEEINNQVRLRIH